MSYHTKLPGIWGALAGVLGVSGLATALDSNPRTLHNWATNKSAVPAIAADRAAGLCEAIKITPLLYTHPYLTDGYVASTPSGWLTFARSTGSWPQRRRYMAPAVALNLADDGDLLSARAYGWPW